MPSHYEIYKGWSVCVEISAHLSRIDPDRKLPDYIPRVIVTEHFGGGKFADREVPEGSSYPTEEECIQRGLLAAQAYIDRKNTSDRAPLH